MRFIDATFACMECGKKFRTTKAAERASYNGCPKCGGCDIDIDPNPAPAKPKKKKAFEAAYAKYKATKAN